MLIEGTGRSRGVLADFEFATSFGDTSETISAGTSSFVALEVYLERFLFLSPTSKLAPKFCYIAMHGVFTLVS